MVTHPGRWSATMTVGGERVGTVAAGTRQGAIRAAAALISPEEWADALDAQAQDLGPHERNRLADLSEVDPEEVLRVFAGPVRGENSWGTPGGVLVTLHERSALL